MLTEIQQQNLQAAVARIIPADDFPDGWEAGAGEYFARLFSREPQFLPRYQAGLDALDREAQAASGIGFSQMDTAAQDALLSRIEQGQIAADWPCDASEFFRLLAAQSMEGFYADPGNGGNQEEIAWRMIGFEARG